jgi:hypothetical protein
MSFYFHLLKASPGYTQDLDIAWNYWKKNGIVSVGYIDDIEKGRKIITRYKDGDTVFVYAIGKGLVGFGRIKYEYRYQTDLPNDFPLDHRHWMGINYFDTASSISDAIPALLVEKILERGNIPLHTVSLINNEKKVTVSQLDNNKKLIDRLILEIKSKERWNHYPLG